MTSMIYHEFSPPTQLQPFVQCLWLLEVNGSQSLQDHILPDAYTELIVHYGLRKDSEEVQEIAEDTIFAGQIRSAFHLELDQEVGMIGVRFKAEGARCFLKESLEPTVDLITPLESWSPHLVAELEERIWKQPTRPERVGEVWRFLSEKLCRDHYDLQVAKVAAHIRERKGELQMSELMNQLGIGQRQIERRFKAVTGLSMKEYHRIIRFKQALRFLEALPRVSMAEVALRAGYYDQAHFHREFKSLVGQTPRRYLEKSGDLSHLYFEQSDVENIQYSGETPF